MAKMSDRKAGREDGGYSRVFGHAKLGALISQVQATSIAAGNDLENLIGSSVTIMTSAQLGELIAGKLTGDIHILSKPLIKRHLKKIIGSTKEPDFVVFKPKEKKAFAIELKDGDQFDTKKSAGEVALIKSFSQALHVFLLSKGLDIAVDIRFCFFNQISRDAIVAGLKGQISKGQALTGAEFCSFIGLNYEAIVVARAADAADNLAHFCKELLAIPDVRERFVLLMEADHVSVEKLSELLQGQPAA
jgi:hypothetical protein